MAERRSAGECSESSLQQRQERANRRRSELARPPPYGKRRRNSSWHCREVNSSWHCTGSRRVWRASRVLMKPAPRRIPGCGFAENLPRFAAICIRKCLIFLIGLMVR